ncbi:MAG: hypothetical protein ACPGKO_09655 [Pseudohongiellaceae bacterium]
MSGLIEEQAVPLDVISLDEKYARDAGRVYITGNQTQGQPPERYSLSLDIKHRNR